MSVQVSTSGHRVLHDGVFKPSGAVPGAKPFRGDVSYVHDLQTSDHRIVVLNSEGGHVVSRAETKHEIGFSVGLDEFEISASIKVSPNTR